MGLELRRCPEIPCRMDSLWENSSLCARVSWQCQNQRQKPGHQERGPMRLGVCVYFTLPLHNTFSPILRVLFCFVFPLKAAKEELIMES